MNYRAKITMNHAGGLYLAGQDVPVDGPLADALVKLGHIEGYEARSLKAETAKNPAKKAAKKTAARTYKRRDMKAQD